MTILSVAHLSDPHITTGPLASAPANGLRSALTRVLAIDPLPSRVVITGDLTEHGHPDEYAVLAELLGGFPLPLHLVPGNHDRPDALVSAFGGTQLLGGAQRARYAIEDDDMTFVVLNSHTDGPSGLLGGEQLRWLDETLSARRELPAFVCLHHPPLAVGIPFLDGMRLDDAIEFATVIARHPRVVRVLAGHVHRPTSAAFAGTIVCTAPSTYRQSTLSQRTDGQLGYLHEPTAFLLHMRTETGQVVTHTVAVSHAAAVTIDW
jgi:Icc protein